MKWAARADSSELAELPDIVDCNFLCKFNHSKADTHLHATRLVRKSPM